MEKDSRKTVNVLQRNASSLGKHDQDKILEGKNFCLSLSTKSLHALFI